MPDLPPPPPQLAMLKTMPTRSQSCENDVKAVQDFVRRRIADRKGAKRREVAAWVGVAALAVVVGMLLARRGK